MEAERRQVTVLFTDMVGFTTFSERSGEEAAYHAYAKPVEADGRMRCANRAASFRALPATASWRSLARRSRSRMRPYELVELRSAILQRLKDSRA